MNVRLRAKAETTVPRPVRAAPDLRHGEEFSCVIEGSRVILDKAPQADLPGDAFQAFGERGCEAARRRCADL